MARWTLTPLGYRPSQSEGHEWELVPPYAPGLPLLMAGAKVVAGQEGLFWIVPISGAVLVLATFAIARSLAGTGVGLAAAWLLATSPTTLFMLMWTMSDVPAAAAWAVAFWALLDPRAPRAAVAGVAVGVAITIRPNLAPLALVLLAWMVLRPRGDEPHSKWRQVAAYLPGVAAGVVVVAVVNTTLHGAPWRSGYGSLAGAFAWTNVWPNIRLYVGWLAETQSPLAVAGLLAVLVPLPRVWRRARRRDTVLASGALVAVVWASYLGYRQYDAWWFLRFMLPSWPFLMAGTAALVLAWSDHGQLARRLAAAATLAVGLWQVHVAVERGAFRLWHDERRSVTAARQVAALTPESAVIFSRQHSGSVRYYAARLTVRFEEFEPGGVDRAVAWFADQERASYLLVDEIELPMAHAALAGQRALDRLAEPPVFHISGGTEVYLYRLDTPADRFAPTVTVRETWADTRSVPPAASGRPGLLP